MRWVVKNIWLIKIYGVREWFLVVIIFDSGFVFGYKVDKDNGVW